MNKRFLLQLAAALVFLSSGTTDALAQAGGPHTVTADVSFSDVTLKWKAPNDKITLQWHDGEDYNGMDGQLSTPEGMVVFYAASKFLPDELSYVAGQTVESINFFEYKSMYKVNVLIYENGKVVREQPADLSGYKKNTWREVKLDNPYTIPAGKTVMFGVKYEYGRNLNFAAICDRTPSNGKGNLYSYDGKTWIADGPGDFLITANIKNTWEKEPTGYMVKVDGKEVSDELLTTTEYTVRGLSDYRHSIGVDAIYVDGDKTSSFSGPYLEVMPHSIYSLFPPVPTVSSTADNLTGTISWQAPLVRGTEMTWSNKQVQTGIGGTSSSAPKVWIKHEFDANDLIAFPNHQITAINAYVYADGTLNGVTAYVMKNGVIDYYEELAADKVTAITPGAWNKFAFEKPYKMEQGNTYAFGLYYTHSTEGHPAGVDTGTAIAGKGNSFSTSGPSSKGFDQSKPSWKTLGSGDISGNFMLTADVEPLSQEAATAQTVAGYDIYRNGEKIKSDVTTTSCTDDVEELGTYTYSVVAKGADGKESPARTTDLTYTLPEEYAAPVILDYGISGKDFSFSWSNEAYEMKHYGTASYMFGFKEEMPDLLYGAKFPKEQMAQYAGYDISSMKFGIGEELDGFSLEIYAGKDLIFSHTFANGEVEPGYIYNMPLDQKVTIPADKDIYLAYRATLPAQSNAILLDNGPASDGGAMVSLTSGANWMKLGTIASNVANYNIVISALAIPGTAKAKAGNKSESVEIGHTPESKLGTMGIITIDKQAFVNSANEGFGIKALAPAAQVKTTAKAAPKAKSYRIYRNNTLVSETTETSYAETLTEYGLLNYHVTTVFENGWESMASKTISVDNTIEQKTEAPYELKGEKNGNDLKLTWKSVSEAPVLTYMKDDGQDLAFGMTSSSSSLEGYQAIRFPAEKLADKVGMEISHIRFKLNSINLLSAAVFVMMGDNIVYEQSVDLTSLTVGWNNVRLNKAVAIPDGQTVTLGYHITYTSGVKPLVCDNGPAEAGYGDLISSSADPSYWYSLKNKFKFDYNWKIAATLKVADNNIAAKAKQKAPTTVMYNVYHNGSVIAENLLLKNYTVSNAAEGTYTVTAVIDGVESAESNAVNFGTTTDIDLGTDDKAPANGTVYGIDGRAVGKSGDTGKLKKGVYIMNGRKFVVK